jgi:hypothetical protein
MRSIFVLVVLSAACGEAPPEPVSVATDSAGVRIVTSAAPSWTAADAWSVGEPTLTLGGDPSDDLFGVVSVARTADGGVVVVDEGSASVRWYDAAGVAIGRAGGEGDGPGELRLPQAMGVGAGDTVWVYDYSHRRVTWYGPDLRVARVASLTPPLGSGVVVGRLPGGAFVLASQFGTGDGPQRTGLVRDTVPYAVYTPDGAIADTLGLFPGRETMHRPEGGRMVMSVAPFARSGSHAVVGERVVVGDQTRHELRTLDAGGGLTSITRWAGAELTVTDEDVRAWIERQVESAHSADRAGLRAQLAETPAPEASPAHGALLPDPTGALWVAEYTQYGLAPAFWNVFDVDGRWLGPVRMPERFRPHEVGPDWIVGVTRDAFDVERVEVRTLDRRGG